MQAECLPSCREAQGLWRAAAAHSGPPPAPGCVCGIYALFAPGRSRGRERMAIVRGAVVLWGRIELHRRGMRAEFARIVTLALPSSQRAYRRGLPGRQAARRRGRASARPAAGGAGLRRAAGAHFHPELRRTHDRTVRRHEEGARDLCRRRGHRAGTADRHARHGPVERTAAPSDRTRARSGTAGCRRSSAGIRSPAGMPNRAPSGSRTATGSPASREIQIQPARRSRARSHERGRELPDPRGRGGAGPGSRNSGALLLYFAVKAIATLPFGVAYRAVVICAPEAVRPPAA